MHASTLEERDRRHAEELRAERRMREEIQERSRQQTASGVALDSLINRVQVGAVT